LGVGVFSLDAHHSNKESDAAHHLRMIEDNASVVDCGGKYFETQNVCNDTIYLSPL
jgi:hypothetical protein